MRELSLPSGPDRQHLPAHCGLLRWRSVSSPRNVGFVPFRKGQSLADRLRGWSQFEDWMRPASQSLGKPRQAAHQVIWRPLPSSEDSSLNSRIRSQSTVWQLFVQGKCVILNECLGDMRGSRVTAGVSRFSQYLSKIVTLGIALLHAFKVRQRMDAFDWRVIASSSRWRLTITRT